MILLKLSAFLVIKGHPETDVGAPHPDVTSLFAPLKGLTLHKVAALSITV